MSEKEIINGLLNELIKTINDCYFLYESHKKSNTVDGVESKNNIVKYNEFKRVYDMINKVSNIDGLKSIITLLKSNITSIVTRQNEMVNLFKTSNTREDKIKYKTESDRLTFKYNVLCELISSIKSYTDKYDKSKDSVNNKTTKMKYSDGDVLSIIAMLNEIKDAKTDLYRNGSTLEKRKRVFDLCSEREKIVESVLGFDGINALGEIESIEDEIYSKSFVSEKEYIIDTNGFKDKLNGIIRELSDTMFYNEESVAFKSQTAFKYRDFLDYKIRQYKNLLSSVGVDGKELLNLLSVYNIDKNYEEFKSKHGNDLIGSDKTSKITYFDIMNKIDGMIDKMVNDGKTFIKEHDGFIKVEDRGRKISDIMGELQSKYASLFDMMVERKNEMTM